MIERARQLRLQTILFLFLTFFGIVPLLVTSIANIVQTRSVLETQEQVNLSRSGELLSESVRGSLASVRTQLEHLANGLGSTTLESAPARERSAGVIDLLERFAETTSSEFRTRVVDIEGDRVWGQPSLPEIQEALERSREEAVGGQSAGYELITFGAGEAPAVVSTMLVTDPSSGELRYLLQAVAPLDIVRPGQGEVFLLDNVTGEVLWSVDADEPGTLRRITDSPAVQEFVRFPGDVIPVFEYNLRVDDVDREMIGQISKLGDTGWAVLVQQPRARAYVEIRKLVQTTIIEAVVIVILASLFALFAARRFAHPIQKLAETARQIASGNFGRRVDPDGIGAEIIGLADSFNQMSGHVEHHVNRLQQAARVNRELFIGTLRSLLRAIEAKEPYTRGHSERVASFSATIARRVDGNQEFAEQMWVAGLLHDVGKIGIDDRILNKGDVLTDDEFAEMKRHPVIGAEIMSSLEQLRGVLPAIRWHHERWGGGGYPDGLIGEQIPLMARIVAVADAFDAMTTQRVYQRQYSPQEAADVIVNLQGTGFDPAIVTAFLGAFHNGELEVGESTERREVPSRIEQARQPVLEEAPVHT